MKTHKNNSRFSKNRQRGVALVAVMLTLLLVTAMAAAIVILANTETYTSSNFSDEQRAFFAAKAGIEEARDRLVSSYTTSGYPLTTLPTTLPGQSATGVLYILNPANSSETGHITPWCHSTSCDSKYPNNYPDDELCNEALDGSTAGVTGTITCTTDSATGKKYASGSYYLTSVNASTTLRPSSGAPLDWKWVRMTLKQNNAFGSGYYVNGSSGSALQVSWNGNGECTSGSTCTLPVYVLTALAVTPGGSRRMIQMEVARDQLNFTAPAALTLSGANDQFTGGSGNNWSVVGTNTTVAGCGASTGPAVAAIGVADGAPASGSGKSAVPATGDINNVISGYGTGTGIPNKNLTDYTGLGTAPDVENVSSTAGFTSSKLDSYSDLTSLVSTLKNDATQPVVANNSSYSGSGNAFNSSASSPQIVYVNGNVTIGGSLTGYGILVVTGTLTMHGSATWNGIVLVVGSGNLQTDGGVNYNGAVVVANTSGGSLGAPTFNVNGGGGKNGQVAYSSGCIAQASQLTTYHSVSFRELIN